MSRLLPSVGDEVLLAVPQTEQVLARVDGDGPGFFDLTLLERPATPRPQLVRSGLMIEFINDDGISRIHGRLDVPSHQRGAVPTADTVRFAHRGSPQLLKRLEYVRATVELPLTLTHDEADEEPVSAQPQALDLSGGGMLARGLAPMPSVGDEFGFELELEEGRAPVHGRCRVARVIDAKRCGLQFTAIEPDARIVLQHLAFEMSRAQRRTIT